MSFSGKPYPKEITLQSVRYYFAYYLPYCDTQEMDQERRLQLEILFHFFHDLCIVDFR